MEQWHETYIDPVSRYVRLRLVDAGVEFSDPPRPVDEMQGELDAVNDFLRELKVAVQDLLETGNPASVKYKDITAPATGVLVALDERRRRLVDRIALLKAQAQMSTIKGVVEAKVEDPTLRQELSGLLSRFAEGQQVEAAKILALEDINAMELRKIELMERRWQVRRTMLDREPAAVLIGGALLIAITAALLIAMFTHTATPEIVSSAFPLILGFFFGQTVGRGKEPSNRELR